MKNLSVHHEKPCRAEIKYRTESCGGDLIIGRGLNDFSLYLGANHDSNGGGTGTFQVWSGSMITRTGVKPGHAIQPGTGVFEVRGSAATTIGIGSQGSLNGWWEQNAGSTLKVRIDYGGFTKIFIDDVEGTDSTYATFEAGALLDVDSYNIILERPGPHSCSHLSEIRLWNRRSHLPGVPVN